MNIYFRFLSCAFLSWLIWPIILLYFFMSFTENARNNEKIENYAILGKATIFSGMICIPVETSFMQYANLWRV